ncbi:MAG: ribosomal RNA small subunit methyltransferase A [Ardenticatenaceae bacterium]|nr:ribosomal RNA small subunit methyltransferase A [Anaerolineales bacterium]MCB8923401.1 ribosomal RNA small subunit methyltransferase A [Ardenticatenaceae bacterium]
MVHPKDILQQHGLEPKKSLGQNFLFDENVLRRIVDAAELEPDDAVLEIGPGLGALTKLLAETAVTLTTIELDNRFIPILRLELAAYPHVRLVHGDILEQDPADWFSGPYKVVANVPYYITGAILRHLLEGAHKPTMMVLTVQKEVAERVTAVPPHMSLLAISTQVYGRTEKVADIKAGSFWPAPDVDSAVIRIDLRQAQPDPAFEKLFFRVVKAGFSQKRKQLQKNLRQLGLDRAVIAQMLEDAGVDGRARAETLTIEQWRALTGIYQQM